METFRTYDSIAEYCAQNGRGKPFRRLLIANNGNAAMKAIKSIRAWCLKTFSNDKAIEIVGMATIDDEMANAEYINRCDYLAKVPDGPNIYNYANVQRIKAAALEWDCDAVWPGWGHASENHRLPQELRSTDVIWIGPSPEAMEALGCKIGSTIIAQSVGVPVVPWSGASVKISKTGDEILTVTDKIRASACLESPVQLLDLIETKFLEFPVMLKAAAGGGGKGIRTIHSVDEVETAFRQVTNEVKGSLVFAMKLVESCRHLEVQVLADNYGTVMSLGCRDCSIQRRHQKIIEEGPPTVAPPEVLEEMEKAAVTLCKAVGYSNAATVEFLYDPTKVSIETCDKVIFGRDCFISSRLMLVYK